MRKIKIKKTNWLEYIISDDKSDLYVKDIIVSNNNNNTETSNDKVKLKKKKI